MAQKFTVTVQGTIDFCDTIYSRDMYVKYTFDYDGDWEALAGSKNGISHTAHAQGSTKAVLNYPITITMASGDPYGWPQIIMAVYGLNQFGNDMILGYGAIHIPTRRGVHEIEVPLFRPKHDSMLSKFKAFFTGLYPELIKCETVANGEDRQVLQTTSGGKIHLTMNVIISDLEPLQLRI